jgi:hypothetical protein
VKFRENSFLWLLATGAVIALLAGADAGKESLGYFVAIRVVVCFTSVYAAVTAYKTKRETWAWLLGANAALYNPFVLVHLTRDTWKLVDLVDLGLIVAAAFALRIRRESRGPSTAITAVAAQAAPSGYRIPTRLEIALWLILLALYLGSAALPQFYDGVTGATDAQKQTHAQELGSVTIGLAFCGYVVARLSRWPKPGRVALCSLLTGLITMFTAAMAGGYTRGAEQSREVSAVLDQIGQFDPELATRLRVRKTGAGMPLTVRMKQSLVRAIQQAPDDAVVTFAHRRYDIIQGNGPVALKRCVAAFQGYSDIDPGSQEQLQMLHALGNLYSAAATAIPIPIPERDVDHDPAAVRMFFVLKQIDPNGALEDEKKRASLSEQEQCDLYTHLMHTLWTLPPRDAATVIRAMVSA